jgi:hypothetical protein
MTTIFSISHLPSPRWRAAEVAATSEPVTGCMQSYTLLRLMAGSDVVSPSLTNIEHMLSMCTNTQKGDQVSAPTPDTVAMQEDVSTAYISLMRGEYDKAARYLVRVSTRLEDWDDDRRVLKIVADKGIGGLLESEWNMRLINKRQRQRQAAND